jgi:hypothetical protein
MEAGRPEPANRPCPSGHIDVVLFSPPRFPKTFPVAPPRGPGLHKAAASSPRVWLPLTRRATGFGAVKEPLWSAPPGKTGGTGGGREETDTFAPRQPSRSIPPSHCYRLFLSHHCGNGYRVASSP